MLPPSIPAESVTKRFMITTRYNIHAHYTVLFPGLCLEKGMVTKTTFKRGVPIHISFLLWQPATGMYHRGTGVVLSLFSCPWFDLIWIDLIWFELIWFDLIWFDLIWFDLIWFDQVVPDEEGEELRVYSDDELDAMDLDLDELDMDIQQLDGKLQAMRYIHSASP